MKIFTPWLRSFLPVLDVDDAQLAEDLTLRGIAVEGVFECNDLAGDSDGAVFDMDITTNRVDAMNHYGIAREAAAIYDLPLHPLDLTLPTHVPAGTFPIRNEAPDLCGRFTAQVIRGVAIAPSEGRVAHYFAELSQKPISNAVDASNFVLLGMGHPTHAFDLDKISGAIIIRRAHPGESLTLLDGTTRTLTPDDLVIADERHAISLAGVMGGLATSITAATRNILVESAWFLPSAIRASSRRHLLHTDASHRFERGADFAAAPIANALVTKLILEACGGTLSGPLSDHVVPEHEATTAARPPLALSIAEVQRHLGTTLDPAGITAPLVIQYLTALGCTLRSTSSETYAVHLPSWRLDLTREIDLVEEIARVYGYNRFQNTLPTPGVVVAHPRAHAMHAVTQRLLALGFTQTLSSTFASPADSTLFAPATPAIPLENPLSDEAAKLRPSLLPGMSTMLAGNLTRDTLTARLFEAGTIFSGSTAEVTEAASLALGITAAPPATNLASSADVPFFELKGAVESVLHLFATPPPTLTAAALPGCYEPGRGASVLLGTQTIATLGQLSQAEASRRKLRQPLWLAAIDLEALLRFPMHHTTAQELSRFQSVERDFSFIFSDHVVWQHILDALTTLGIAELRSLRPVELWRDAKKFPGVYATLIRTTFQADDRTLTDADLTLWWSRIISALQALGGKIRDGIDPEPPLVPPPEVHP